ncbi:MAG: IMP dehydrogenase, partial [Streptococcaceae bacterium]|nr:IMP dehydrogenase [Streptococcaceae bacterium]
MNNGMPVFDYEDIQLIPNKCMLNSRSEADTSVQFGGHTFKIPIVPANMQTIIDEKIAETLAREGYFYIMHRFDEEKRPAFIQKMKAHGLIASISVGVKEYEYHFIDDLSAKNLIPDYITIDIAHGHSESVIRMIKYIKEKLPLTFVIAGNVGTPEAVRELENAGADATKVGIG